jgi:hypothetical protein
MASTAAHHEKRLATCDNKALPTQHAQRAVAGCIPLTPEDAGSGMSSLSSCACVRPGRSAWRSAREAGRPPPTSARSDLLMLAPSRSFWPTLLVSAARSLPARSTRVSLPVRVCAAQCRAAGWVTGVAPGSRLLVVAPHGQPCNLANHCSLPRLAPTTPPLCAPGSGSHACLCAARGSPAPHVSDWTLRWRRCCQSCAACCPLATGPATGVGSRGVSGNATLLSTCFAVHTTP